MQWKLKQCRKNTHRRAAAAAWPGTIQNQLADGRGDGVQGVATHVVVRVNISEGEMGQA